MQLIAICGFQGSGKDTVAAILVEHGFVKMSFAGLLKDIISILFQWDRDLLEGITTESRRWRETVDEWWATRLHIPDLTPRYVLQHIGTDVFRNHFHPDIWVAALERKLINYMNSKNLNKVVITDCRFSNEIEMIRKLNGLFVHVHRGNLPSWFGKEDEFPKNIHVSELEWTKMFFDKSIDNTRITMEELKCKVFDILININSL
jgi:hypothetical protein